MALTSSAAGFFGHHSDRLTKPKAHAKRSYVDVGGIGDCGFRAVAAGLIDAEDEALFSMLLPHYFRYFPHAESLGCTSLERVKNMTRTPLAMAKFVRELAYVLRQLAVDEMCQFPGKYRGAFINNGAVDRDTSPQEMRKESTWIDETVIFALANKLGIPIDVDVRVPGKTIPLCLHYNPEATQAPLVKMQLQHGHYIPAVTHPAVFQRNSHSEQSITPNATATGRVDPPLSEIMAKIKAHDKRVIDEFDQAKRRLTAMVAAGELTKDQLLSMYIEGMSTSDYLRGRIHYVGVEYGHQQFFEIIKQAKEGVIPVITSTGTLQHDEGIIVELIHAIARATTIGQMDKDKVFGDVERPVVEHDSARLSV